MVNFFFGLLISPAYIFTSPFMLAWGSAVLWREWLAWISVYYIFLLSQVDRGVCRFLVPSKWCDQVRILSLSLSLWPGLWSLLREGTCFFMTSTTLLHLGTATQNCVTGDRAPHWHLTLRPGLENGYTWKYPFHPGHWCCCCHYHRYTALLLPAWRHPQLPHLPCQEWPTLQHWQACLPSCSSALCWKKDSLWLFLGFPTLKSFLWLFCIGGFKGSVALVTFHSATLTLPPAWNSEYAMPNLNVNENTFKTNR